MAQNLSPVMKLLDDARVEMRCAAALVLGAVGKGDAAVVKALSARLADDNPAVRRLALDGLAEMGATGIAGALTPLLRSDDEELAARAVQLLATQGAGAETALRKELGNGSVAARRQVALLLVKRGTAGAIDALLDQLGDEHLGEQVLQLLRAELDVGGDRLIETIGRRAGEAIAAAGKEVAARLAEQNGGGKRAAAAGKAKATATAKAAKGKAADTAGNGKGSNGHTAAATAAAEREAREAAAGLARDVRALSSLLRLVGYVAEPGSLKLLVGYSEPGRPLAVRLAAIAAMRRIVASSEAKGTEPAIAALIDYCDDDDHGIAQAAVDTLRGARIPDKLSKAFAGLAKSKHAAAQKLAMERLPATRGGGATIKTMVDALRGGDTEARDAAARALGHAPEAALPLARALAEVDDEAAARRLAGVLRQHRGHVSTAAVEALVAAVEAFLDGERDQAFADPAQARAVERVIAECVAEVAPQAHVGLLFDRAARLRKASKHAEAFASLRPLLRSRADLDTILDDEQRFLLALLGLKAAGQDVIRIARGADPILQQFRSLGRRGFAVAKQLTKQKDVEDADLYALGFCLVESHDDEDKELGAEILQGIIDERPRSKLAKAAKNKLKISDLD